MSSRNLGYKYTVDWEIFTLKIICVTNFCVVKFWLFRSICKNFAVVNDCNMDKLLESSWRLVYYQVSGEQGIACCSCWSDVYFGECGPACKFIHWSSLRNFIFHMFNFRGWSQLQNYFNSEIFLIYGTLLSTMLHLALI